MKTPPKLLRLRAAIDRIDDQLHVLLRERAAVIAEVPAVKGKQHLYIRPGREAAMMRALLDRPQGKLPPGLIGRLWREMIGRFTLTEGGMKIAVAEDLWDMTRDYYGSYTPLAPYADAAKAFAALTRGKVHIAVLPLPGRGANWWTKLARHPELRVFARLPFDQNDATRCNWRGNRQGALAVARLDPEPTGEDHGLILIENAAPSAIRAALGKKLVTLRQEGRFRLAVTDGLADTALLAGLKHKGLRARCIGGYNLPVALKGY